MLHHPRVSMLTALLLVCLSACASSPPPPARETVTIAGRTYHLELALDAPSRHTGLADRREIAADGGMLFVFPEAEVRYFVMRRCLVPIAVIFLDGNGVVVAMHEMAVEPYDRAEADLRPYPSLWPAQFAIELPGGTVEALRGRGLAPGARIELRLEQLKAWAR